MVGAELMAWITLTEGPGPPHACRLPEPVVIQNRRIGIDSVWQCDGCDRQYEISALTERAGHTVPVWTQVTGDRQTKFLIEDAEGVRLGWDV